LDGNNLKKTKIVLEMDMDAVVIATASTNNISWSRLRVTPEANLTTSEFTTTAPAL
jgi:hypothetical protein